MCVWERGVCVGVCVGVCGRVCVCGGCVCVCVNVYSESNLGRVGM